MSVSTVPWGASMYKGQRPDCRTTKKSIQPTHESPLNHLWDPKLSELRPRTCVFFLQGRGLANGFYFCVFQLTPVETYLQPSSGSPEVSPNSPTPQIREAWGLDSPRNSWIDSNPSPSLRRFIGCHKYDVIKPEVMRENVHTKLRVLSMNIYE